MDTKNMVLVGAVALMPVIQNAAMDEAIPACGIEAAKSTALACSPKQPAQHHVEHSAGAPTYQPTIGITVTPTYPAPIGAIVSVVS